MAYTQKVWPDNGAREGRYIFFCIAILLLLGMVTIPLNQRDNGIVELEAHQLRVDQMSVNQQTLLSQLKIAHEEIVDIYQDNLEFDGADQWPNVDELEALYLAPFVKDHNWNSLAQLDWHSLEDGRYLGKAANDDLGYQSVLLDSQAQDAVHIWLHRASVERPEIDLIKTHWQEAVFVQTSRQAHHH
ncbi:DUF6162 family protein [Vibrio sp. WXL210]|uniref:DUF6162 family protein n=1 Tax=Vibrio sp. WXL210 TaxID=3450709 RepID=UPI003EC6F045